MNKEEMIQAYIKGRLGKADKAEFDRLFESDADFRKEVGFHQDINAAFSAMERERLKAKLQQFEADLKSPSKKKFTLWLAAACILAIVGFGLIAYFNGPTQPKQLYANYFEPYENVVQPITRGESIESLKKEVFIDYEKREYQKAATGFKMLFEETHKPYYLLYQANALMAANEVEKAVPVLKKHLAFQDAFSEKTRWYLALAYLKTKETDKATTLLREIVEKQSYKFSQAKAILEELE